MGAFGFTTLELGGMATAAASTVVGLYIGLQAYRGLRRHDSPAMRYLSAGLLLLTAVTYTTAFVGTLLFRAEVLPLPYQDAFRLGVRALQLSGLLCIAYSLHVRR